MKQKIITAVLTVSFLFLAGVIAYLFSQNQSLTLSLENAHSEINSLEDELALKNTALKNAESDIAKLDSKVSELENQNASLQAEIDSLKEEKEELKKALVKAQTMKTPESSSSDGDAAKQPEDTLTEKDLETIKEKVKNGQMNDFLKETIGSMSRTELMKLARDLGLLSVW